MFSVKGEIRLKPKEDLRLQSGHQWVFSNEIASIHGDPSSGDFVWVRSATGKTLGSASYSKSALIAARLFTRGEKAFSETILVERLKAANARRSPLQRSTYRLVFGESDFLPGLVIDRYEDTYVVESYSAAVDSLLPFVCDILVREFNAQSIIEKSSSVWRTFEGLEMREGLLVGESPSVDITLNGLVFHVEFLESQKTGLFLDQIGNHAAILKIAEGKAVLDCFCNAGGFLLNALQAGAVSGTGVDSSKAAIEAASRNAKNNNLPSASLVTEDVFDFLGNAHRERRQWDIIVLDPPSFVKSKKTLSSGIKGYRKLNEAALRLIPDEGHLITCSCSQHVDEQALLAVLNDAASRANKILTIESVRGAGPDHPVLLSMPETRYLNCITARVFNA